MSSEIGGTPKVVIGCATFEFPLDEYTAQDPDWQEELLREGRDFIIGMLATRQQDTVVLGSFETTPEDPDAWRDRNQAALAAPDYLPEYPPIPDAETSEFLDQNPHLNLSLEELLQPQLTSDQDAVRKLALQCLNLSPTRGVATVRQLFAMGKKATAKIPGFGPGIITLLEQSLALLQDPSLEWKDKPTISDLVKLCADVYAVPGPAAGYYFDAQMSTSRLAAMSESALAAELYYQDRYKRDRPSADQLPPAEPEAVHFTRAKRIKKEAMRIDVEMLAILRAPAEQ